ncbi:hypothetical protein [Paenibacillus sp. FSL L8-0494]|uniref:hypothetical protein n=1 Tax=Paenibacillus sp. FSL L8-0494 TaxID=2975352 RepID=UPI0030FBD9C2
MTQVKDKTDQQLNRVLAELMGWIIKTTTDGEREFYDDGGFCSGKWVEPSHINFTPDYTNVWSPCTDPAASLEVQTAACNERFYWYIQALSKVVGADGYWDSGALDYEGITLLLTASPRERAEAAYITLQGAKDDNS